MSRRKRIPALSQPWVKNTLVVAIIVIFVVVCGVFLAKGTSLSSAKDSLPFVSSHDESEDNQDKSPDNVSTDITERLSEGTALVFGAKPNPSKPVVSIVGDPSILSRKAQIVDGKPSKFMNAVNHNKITVYYYPVGKEDKKLSTDSITRASICRIGAEKTKTGIFTLTGIVNTGDKVKGDEKVGKVSKMMGMSSGVKCPTSTNEASTQTVANGEFFAEHFGLGRDGNGDSAVVVGDEVTTHPEYLPDNWVETMISGKPLREIIPGGDSQ